MIGPQSTKQTYECFARVGQDYQKIKLRKIGSYFGAEVTNVDFTQKLNSKR